MEVVRLLMCFGICFSEGQGSHFDVKMGVSEHKNISVVQHFLVIIL